MRITLTVMTPVWPTNDVRWHPWQTFAPPPLHIWPLPLSQTTLVKQDDVGDGKTYPSSMSEKAEEKFIIQTFVPKLTLISRDFSQLRAQDPRENANVFPPLAFFSFVIFLPRVSWEDGKRNRSFWHIPRCTPWDIALPAIVNVHFNFGAGHTIFLFGWFCTNTSSAHIAICIFQRHISLLFKFPVCYFQIF